MPSGDLMWLWDNIRERVSSQGMPPATKPASPPSSSTHSPHPLSFLEYLSSSLIVVQVHQPPCILFDFSGINKPPGELNAVSDIRRAASPLPALLLVVVALFLSVTATIAEVALAAGGRDSVCNPGSSNGIGERSFPASCGEKPKADGLAKRQHVLTKESTHIIYSKLLISRCSNVSSLI